MKCIHCEKEFSGFGRAKYCSIYCAFTNQVKRSNNGCLEFTGARDKRKYGIIGWNGKRFKAHRIAWELSGKKIPKGHSMRHKCDNPSCVDINHLETGTHAENMKDMVVRNRIPKGSHHKKSKLHESDIPAIRRLLAEGKSHEYIGKQYNIGSSTVSQINTGETWSHVK